MLRPLILFLNIYLLARVSIVNTLKCPECLDDDCGVAQFTTCQSEGVSSNMIRLRQVYNNLYRTHSDQYACLNLIYKESSANDTKKLLACVESGISYCDFPTKEGIHIWKCALCHSNCDNKEKEDENSEIILLPFAEEHIKSFAINSLPHIFIEIFVTIIVLAQLVFCY